MHHASDDTTVKSSVHFIFGYCITKSRKLCYYISYADGSYSRRANISVPQTAIDEQALGNELVFGKIRTGPGEKL